MMAASNEDDFMTEIENVEGSTGINKHSNESKAESLSKPKVIIYPSKVCSYFSKTGFCKFGDTCRYIHKKGCGNGKRMSKPLLKKSVVPKIICEDNPLNNEDVLLLKESRSWSASKQVCRYFMAGHCNKSDNCKFRHSSDCQDSKYAVTDSSISQKCIKMVYTANNRTYKKKPMPVCYFFKKGQCYKGDQCKYYHQNKYFSNSESFSSFSNQNNLSSSSLNKDTIAVPFEENLKTEKSSVILKKALSVFGMSSTSTEDVPLLRATEITQLKKRFPHHEMVTENKFSLIFQPSDPDWPFDVRNLKIEIEFPEGYPIEKCAITVIQDADIIPQLLIKHLNNEIRDWITKKYEDNSVSDKVELIFRPFLKWFDRNLEDLFITGLRKVKQDFKAKEDGIEFVPVEKLFPSSDSNSNCDISIYKEDINKDITKHPIQLPSQTISPDPKDSLAFKDKNKLFQYVGNDAMKILLSELELTEGAAAFVCTKISVTLQCCRCKTSFNLKSVPKKNNSLVCSKCSKNVGFTFEPNTVHQFSNVLGNLHLLDSVAVDVNLVECHFLVDCLSCSKQVPTDIFKSNSSAEGCKNLFKFPF